MKNNYTFGELVLGAVVATLTSFFVGLAFPGNEKKAPEVYPMAVTVVDISEALDVVTVKDTNENLWQFHGIEDYMVGDVVACIVDTNGTPEIKDDIIIQTRYNG